jgi:transcriptional regulator NrdR family protein
MSDLRVAAEALLQTAQIHQLNFEAVSAELRAARQRHLESDQLFEILLADLRQLKIDSDRRFDELQRRFDQS